MRTAQKVSRLPVVPDPPTRAARRTAAPLSIVIAVATILAWQRPVVAQQTTGSVAINDLSDLVTAQLLGGTNQVNQTVTADPLTPELLNWTISVDGSVPAGTGVAIMLGDLNGAISDILQVTITPKTRGQGIQYFDASGIFTSDTDGTPLDLAGLGLAPEIVQKIMDNALYEDGTFQDIGARLIDTTTGNQLNIGGLTITAASDIPEPSALAFLGASVIPAGIFIRRCRRPRGKRA